MTSAPDAPGGSAVRCRRCRKRRGRQLVDAGRLADGVGERLQIVSLRDRRGEFTRVANDVPAAGHREPHGVLLAQIVGMRFSECREGPDDGGRVGIHVGQSGDRRSTTSGPTAAAHAPHSRGR